MAENNIVPTNAALNDEKGPIWSEFYISDAGRLLRTKAIAESGQIYFTGAAVGEGKPSDPQKIFAMTELVAYAQPAKITDSFEQSANHVLSIVVDNKEFPEEVLVSEVNVLAKLGVDGEEIMYGYAYCVSGYALLPPGSSSNRIWRLIFDTHISHSSDVTIVYDSSALYVTPEQLEGAVNRHNLDDAAHPFIKEALQTHVDDKENPHGVGKTHVGLGNVPNVATNDQTPTYTEASAPAALTSGEKLSVAFGKIAAAIKALIAHLANKENPHGVNAEQSGALAKGGTAAAATKLATPRALSITGAVTASAKNFDGTAPVALEATGIDVSKATAGTLAVNRGGIGISTLAANNVLEGNGTGAMKARAITATPASGSSALLTAGGAYTALSNKANRGPFEKISLTLIPDVIQYYPSYYYKGDDGRVYVHCIVQSIGDFTGQTMICTMPEGYIPPSEFFVGFGYCENPQTGNRVVVAITHTTSEPATLRITAAGTAINGNRLYFDINYIPV